MLVAAVVVGPFTSRGLAASGMPHCNVPGQFTPHPVNWFSVRAPKFPSGNPGMLDFAVEPLVAERLYVTNGSVVMRSSDYGCHWTKAYELPATGAGPTAANSSILEIEVSAPGTIYLPIQQKEPFTQPHVAVSTDAGKSWALSDGPALSATPGIIRDLDASLGNGRAAAMLVDTELAQSGVGSVRGAQVVFFTDTGGDAWEPRWNFDKGTNLDVAGVGVNINSGLGQLGSLSMNPLRPNEIWVYGEAGVFRTQGNQMVPVDLGNVSALDVSLDGQAVVAYSAEAGTANFSLDGGQRFTEYNTQFPVESVDVARGVPPVSALSGLGQVYYQVPQPNQTTPYTEIVTPLDGRSVGDVQVGIVETVAAPWIFGRTADTIEITWGPEGPEVPQGKVLTTIQEPPALIGDNELVPDTKNLTMRAGERKTIPYKLTLPASTTPLDVYFMIDVSGSMGGTISGVRSAMQEIANRLNGMKIDAQFGVGSFRAFNDPPAYERNRDIGPADASLASALNSLSAGGGGNETQMFALEQSVTGAGGFGVEKGLNMNFRPGSLRVAIEATDEPISTGGNHPMPLDVAETLRAHGVKMTGLAIQDAPLLGEHDYENPGQPASTLQEVASGTKAVAPPGGVDCDGDGAPEIPEGGPIVCIIAPSEADNAALMADAIVNVLNAIEDIQDLNVYVSPELSIGSASGVIESIEPATFPSIDLKKPSFHQFEVTVRCPRVLKKTVYPLNVDVARRSGILARGTLSLTCKPIPVKEKKRETPPLIAFFPIAAVLPPVPRPPEPVSEPNPNPQPNPQQQAQAQGAIAAQRQHQTQLALAHQQLQESAARELASEDFSFVNTRQESRVPPFGVIASAAVMTAAAAYGLALQRAHALKRAYNRRSRWP